MSESFSIINFWPKMLRFTRFVLGKIETFWKLTGVKDVTNSMSGGAKSHHGHDLRALDPASS